MCSLARQPAAMCWLRAQGVQHLTCVRSISSDHSAATRHLKQSSLVIWDDRLASSSEKSDVGSSRKRNVEDER
jgi:hypothetical protein